MVQVLHLPVEWELDCEISTERTILYHSTDALVKKKSELPHALALKEKKGGNNHRSPTPQLFWP